MNAPAWTKTNRPVSDDDAADHLGNGHPKSKPPTLHDGNSFPAGTTGAGSAPGANTVEPYPAPGARGQAVSGPMSPGGPLSST